MIQVVIFDMDDVIADTQKYHSITESQVLSTYNIYITPEQITQRFSGVNDKVQFETLFLENGLVVPNLDKITTQKWECMSQIKTIEPITGALEIIQTLKNLHIPISIASSSPLHFIKHVTQTLSIQDLFENLTSGEEVKNGKPDPEIFVLSANRMNIFDYSNYLVIEDGLLGMKGAKACGMRCLALSSEHIEWVDYCTNNFKNISIRNIVYGAN